ncbi:MAG: enoyl-CoA hydratase/isomerase family protein [Acidimicrobiales bacterium]|nr:enoyl-CoA hydratase/isomerase family protein [Acidimicrobiales bacterium]
MIDHRTEGPVAHITLRRPEKHNALTSALTRELVDAVGRAGVDDAVKVVLIDGEGPAFCAGFDIGDPADFQGGADEPQRQRIASIEEKSEWMRALFTSRKPIVLGVHGACLGIGTYLVLVADFVVASDDAAFGLPEERFGSAGATWAYPFLAIDVGMKRATEMVMTGRRYDADEAHRMGLVTSVVPRERLEDECRELTSALASLPREGIAVSRAVRNLVLNFTGHLGAFAFHAVAHPLAEHLQREPDEFDFMAEIDRQGLRGAVRARNERFEGPYWRW